MSSRLAAARLCTAPATDTTATATASTQRVGGLTLISVGEPCTFKSILHYIYPIGSMYGIYGNIYHQYTPNVSIYTIHGSYGLYILVGGFNRLEQYESMGRIIPYIMEK